MCIIYYILLRMVFDKNTVVVVYPIPIAHKRRLSVNIAINTNRRH